MRLIVTDQGKSSAYSFDGGEKRSKQQNNDNITAKILCENPKEVQNG